MAVELAKVENELKLRERGWKAQDKQKQEDEKCENRNRTNYCRLENKPQAKLNHIRYP